MACGETIIDVISDDAQNIWSYVYYIIRLFCRNNASVPYSTQRTHSIDANTIVGNSDASMLILQ